MNTYIVELQLTGYITVKAENEEEAKLSVANVDNNDPRIDWMYGHEVVDVFEEEEREVIL